MTLKKSLARRRAIQHPQPAGGVEAASSPTPAPVTIAQAELPLAHALAARPSQEPAARQWRRLASPRSSVFLHIRERRCEPDL